MRSSPRRRAGLVVDADLEPQVGGQVGFEGAGVGVLDDRAGRGLWRVGAGEAARQRLGLAHRQVALDHLARERLGVGGGDERAGVAGAEPAGAQVLEHRLGQRQQAQQVGDVAAALAERLGEALLGVAEAVHQLAVALRLLDGVEVGALHVLDDGEFEHLGVVEIAHHRGQLVHRGELRRPPAPLAGDDLEAGRVGGVRAQDQRLDHALLADRGGEVLEVAARRTRGAAGPGWPGSGRSGPCAGPTARCRGRRGDVGADIGEQGGEAAAEALLLHHRPPVPAGSASGRSRRSWASSSAASFW